MFYQCTLPSFDEQGIEQVLEDAHQNVPPNINVFTNLYVHPEILADARKVAHKYGIEVHASKSSKKQIMLVTGGNKRTQLHSKLKATITDLKDKYKLEDKELAQLIGVTSKDIDLILNYELGLSGISIGFLERVQPYVNSVVNLSHLLSKKKLKDYETSAKEKGMSLREYLQNVEQGYITHSVSKKRADRLDLPINTVVTKYVEHGHSAKKIAATYQTSIPTILLRLREQGVKVRSRGR